MPDSPQTESFYRAARDDDDCISELGSDIWELSDPVDDSVKTSLTRPTSLTNATSQQSHIAVGSRWEAIGPFSSGTREHSFVTSPLAAFPETSTDRKVALLPFDLGHTWPSELVDGGQVGWTTFETSSDGWVNVSYPKIRWSQLRDAHGWAALQHQVVLRTEFTLYPRDLKSANKPRPVLVELISGTEFALIRKDSDDQESATWHNGDVYAYALEQGPVAQASIFAHRIDLIPGDYVLLLRVNFEIRLAGDPGIEPPNIRFKFNAALDTLREDTQSTTFQVLPELHVKPDMVDGIFMGQHFGIGLRKVNPVDMEEDWSLDRVKITGKDLSFSGYDDFVITSGGLVVIPLHLVQSKPVEGCPTALNLTLVMRASSGWAVNVPIRLEITHHHSHKCSSFLFTFTTAPNTDKHLEFAPALISHAVAIPPIDARSPAAATILALHGAGVDATSKAWIDAIPKRPNGWAILPTGRTSWGEDWHGGSMQDAWGARDALKPILATNGEKGWSSESVGEGTILMGHSNGGQGAWHLASHWPDRVVGVVAAAGYSKIQDYVPYSSWISNHHADPALMGILNSALSPYNNDLYMSNLRDIPVLAVHGADDHNVPPQHSRLQVKLVQSRQGGRDTATLIEVPGKDHWWPEVLKRQEVLDFLDGLPCVKPKLNVDGTTLVTYNPSETGSKNGIRIIKQGTPGQCSKLTVSKPSDTKLLQASVNHVFTVVNTTILSYAGSDLGTITIGGDIIDTHGKVPCSFVLQDSWVCVPHSACHRITGYSSVTVPVSTGPMAEVLASRYAVNIVAELGDIHYKSAAIRLQHDLFVYHRIQARNIRMIADNAVSGRRGLGPGTLACLGSRLLRRDAGYGNEGEAGWIGRYRHPSFATSVALVISGFEVESFKRALRLFPLRTGVPLPHWITVGPDMDWQGAGGFLGAGFIDLGSFTSPSSPTTLSWGCRPPQ